jgi:hypothetical protein
MNHYVRPLPLPTHGRSGRQAGRSLRGAGSPPDSRSRGGRVSGQTGSSSAETAYSEKRLAQKRLSSSGAGRQQLFNLLDGLPQPPLGAFRQPGQQPAAGELERYRVEQHAKVRAQLVRSGLAQIVQSPGPGNWKKSKPPYIVRIYPNFDAPTATRPTRKPSNGTTHDGVGRAHGAATPLFPAAVIHDLRTKWELYYLDTRPDNQRRYEQRAQSIDPTVILSRAKEIITEGRRANRPVRSRDAVLQATDELTSDFETSMRRKYGDIVVDVLGIPDATDKRPPE